MQEPGEVLCLCTTSAGFRGGPPQTTHQSRRRSRFGKQAEPACIRGSAPSRERRCGGKAASRPRPKLPSSATRKLFTAAPFRLPCASLMAVDAECGGRSPAANPMAWPSNTICPRSGHRQGPTRSSSSRQRTGETFVICCAIVASPPMPPKPTKRNSFCQPSECADRRSVRPQPPDRYADGSITALMLSSSSARLAKGRQCASAGAREAGAPYAGRGCQAVIRLSVRRTDQADRARAGGLSLEGPIGRARRSDKDGSQPWPDDRKVVELGCWTLNKAVPNSLEAETKLLFMPTSLTDGIELSDDPLPVVRTGAYGVSFARRSRRVSKFGPGQHEWPHEQRPRQASMFQP